MKNPVSSQTRPPLVKAAESPISSGFAELTSVIGRLEEEYGNLEKRLDPVRKHLPESPCEPSGRDNKDLQSTMLDTIKGCTIRIDILTSRLVQMLNQLDL